MACLPSLTAIYRKQDYGSANSNSTLEVVWAPVFLMHLGGGQDLITAYNMEDNELWTRHVLTAVSQITVVIYVFCKSWPGGDKRLLQASIFLFVPGILKCIEKPWALKSASFNSLVRSSVPYLHPEMMTGRESRLARPLRMVGRICKDISLEEYVQKARAFVLDKCRPQAREEGHTIEIVHNHVPQAEGETNGVDLEGNDHHQDQGKCEGADLEPNHVPQAQGETDAMDLEPSHHRKSHEKSYADDFKPNQAPKTTRWRRFCLMFYTCELPAASLSEEKERFKERERDREKRICKKKKWRRLDLASRKLFVDLASSYPDRLSILEKFLVKDADKSAYASLQKGLSETFDLIYTKKKMAGTKELTIMEMIGFYTRLAATCLPFAAIGLFHHSHREIYNANDVKVTYALFCCSAVLEMFASPIVSTSEPTMSGMVAQYSLVDFFVRNIRDSKKMSVLSSLNCKDFLDQRWCMKSCSSSSRITELVLGHVKGWWTEHITDAASFRRFSDHRGQWTLQHKRCEIDMRWSLNRPFDESVLLWHIATDLCFYQNGGTSVSHEKATECREISNYMIYLLFVNPEMLLSGTRRDLFMVANAELEKILMGDKPLLKKIVKGDKPSLTEILKGNKPFLEFLKGKGPSSEEIERGFMQRIIANLQPREIREEDPGYTEPPTEAEQCPPAEQGFIQDSWKISKVLLALGDEKMWEVIEGVWVEMLCFSASRCRGYLHAKSLGTGVELLTYIWLLLSRMGMETLPEKLQRTELSSGEGNAGAPPLTSQIHEMEDPTNFMRGLFSKLLAHPPKSNHTDVPASSRDKYPPKSHALWSSCLRNPNYTS